ncbi:hypothetical protein EVAR_14832_1 [Eumeta japonica]|uniref:Uncharacterized protein n=1 Tax=Eumeta variegata TaxID=151549 RepID=A0A4C1V2Z2_EUMVA|nr:hypothetical protein EVAR_14832_1 [Eumeta japonica]
MEPEGGYWNSSMVPRAAPRRCNDHDPARQWDDLAASRSSPTKDVRSRAASENHRLTPPAIRSRVPRQNRNR